MYSPCLPRRLFGLRVQRSFCLRQWKSSLVALQGKNVENLTSYRHHTTILEKVHSQASMGKLRQEEEINISKIYFETTSFHMKSIQQ